MWTFYFKPANLYSSTVVLEDILGIIGNYKRKENICNLFELSSFSIITNKTVSSGDKNIFYPQNKPLESGWIIFLFWYKDVRRRQANNIWKSPGTGLLLLLHSLNPQFLQMENGLITRLINVIYWAYLPVTTHINCLNEKLCYLERGRCWRADLSWALGWRITLLMRLGRARQG